MYKFPVIKHISNRNVMYSMINIITPLYVIHGSCYEIKS